MDIVTAGVHHADFLAQVILRLDLARIRHLVLFFNRQGIDVGAHEHCRAIAVLHDGDDSITGELRSVVFADSLRHRVAERTKLISEEG